MGVADGIGEGFVVALGGGEMPVDVGATGVEVKVAEGNGVSTGLVAVGISGNLGTNNFCPLMIWVDVPKQFACCNWAMVVPVALPIINSVSPDCTV